MNEDLEVGDRKTSGDAEKRAAPTQEGSSPAIKLLLSSTVETCSNYPEEYISTYQLSLFPALMGCSDFFASDRTHGPR
jgi:hypothetical protein